MIIELNSRDVDKLAGWIKKRSGALVFDDVTFEAVEGGGVWVRVREGDEK